MKILVFDTALDKTYIALSENCTIIEKMAIETNEDKYHSAFLIQEIANILKKNNLTMQNIDAVGINVGPGSFTGIRACTTVGRVIAQQIETPLVPVSSLEVLSFIGNSFGNGKTLVTLDARKESAFYGIYENGIEIESPKMVKVEEIFEKTNGMTVVCDSNMFNKLKTQNISAINYEDGNYPLNEYLANITFEKLNNSKDAKNEYHWAKVKPLYIQPPSVFGKPLEIN